jgi:uncharacterized protein DUF6152
MPWLLRSPPVRAHHGRRRCPIKTQLAAAIGLILSAAPAMAHHSFAAEYDARRPVTLAGVVTKIEWTNPHSHCYIDVTDETGHVINWKVELASPKVLAQYGWRINSMRVADTITIEGSLAKDGSKTANARSVTLADGRIVYAGSSGGDLPSR